MRIVFEKGKAGLWYATTENCDGLYRGLLVVGPTVDSVIDMLPAAFKDLRDAARDALKSCAVGQQDHE